MKLRWAVAQKDFTFRGRVFAAGEVFQERSELVGIFIFQKKAKPASAPPAAASAPVPAPVAEPEPAPAAETWEPIAEIAPIESDMIGFDASQPDEVAITETPANSEPAPSTVDIEIVDGPHGVGDEDAPTPALRRKYQRRAPKSVTE